MQKNSGKNFSTVEVDPVTGDYIIIIPEFMINDLGWYEDTELECIVEGDEIILSEIRE